MLPAKKQKRNENEDDEGLGAKDTIKVTYNISIFSVEELKKPIARREPKGCFVVSASNITWPDLHAQLKIQFCDALHPTQAFIADNSFEITYTISRLVPHPLPLATAKDYAHLLTNVAKMKSPATKVIMKELFEQGVNRNLNVSIHLSIFVISF